MIFILIFATLDHELIFVYIAERDVIAYVVSFIFTLLYVRAALQCI